MKMHHCGSMYCEKDTAVILYNNIYDDSPEDVIDNRTQANWIFEVLIQLGYNAVKMQFTPNCIDTLARMKKNCKNLIVINMVDSAPNEENLAYLVPSILEYLKIKYTGNSHDAVFLTTNKVFTKRLLKHNSINTPDWLYENDNLKFSPNERYIIKALTEDASIGLYDDSVLTTKSLRELKKLIHRRQTLDKKLFYAEKYIDGREFNVCIYGNQNKPIILPPYEWIFDGFNKKRKIKIINYDAKWTEGTYEYEHIYAVYDLPAEDSYILMELKKITRKCWDLFKLNGYARIDFRVDNEGKIWVLEINCNPSFYGFRNIAKHKGLDFSEILKCIIDEIITENEPLHVGSEQFEFKKYNF